MVTGQYDFWKAVLYAVLRAVDLCFSATTHIADRLLDWRTLLGIATIVIAQLGRLWQLWLEQRNLEIQYRCESITGSVVRLLLGRRWKS